MGQFVKENAHLNTDLKKFHENFDAIDWGKKASFEDSEIKDAEAAGDTGTRMATNLELCELKLLAANQRIKELEDSEAYFKRQYEKAWKMLPEADAKLATAIEALKMISKNCYGRPTEMMTRAREALAKIKENSN